MRTPDPEYLGLFLVGSLVVFVLALLLWIIKATVHRARITALERAYRHACETGDTARADQLGAELRNIRASGQGSSRGNSQ
ncbi:hypothetical protein ACFVRD_33125 [Streptomyces sp. NPDC057908]|uniref:hypothetical protein n=1 Tax=Streptomyces sp. NPDC057908 TaxID=3346276 RepID=UPI0036ECB466